MATFFIEDVPFTLGGVFVPSVPNFACCNATLRYGSLSQLSSTRLIEGSIGAKGLALRLVNGPIIKGALEQPFYHRVRLEVIGCGIWFQS